MNWITHKVKSWGGCFIFQWILFFLHLEILLDNEFVLRWLSVLKEGGGALLPIFELNDFKWALSIRCLWFGNLLFNKVKQSRFFVKISAACTRASRRFQREPDQCYRSSNIYSKFWVFFWFVRDLLNQRGILFQKRFSLFVCSMRFLLERAMTLQSI